MYLEICTQYILKNNARSEVKIKQWPKIKSSCNGKLDQEELLWPLKMLRVRKQPTSKYCTKHISRQCSRNSVHPHQKLSSQ